MKKKIAFIIIILIAVVLIVVDIVTYKPFTYPSYFVWADKAINVYDIKNRTKKAYEFDEYNCHDIGKYYGGDFCCIGEKNNIEYALLFEGGNITNYIHLPYKAEQIAAGHEIIIFRSEEKIFSIDLQSQECNLLVDNVSLRPFYLNENGDIAFLRDSYEENNDADVFALYVYSNNKEEHIGNVYDVFYWQSNEELVARTFYSYHYEESSHHTIYKSERNDYIINVNTKVWEKTKLFKKADSVVSWKQGSTAICWFSQNSFIGDTETPPMLGIANIDTKDYLISLYRDEAIDAIGNEYLFEWYEENPMEKHN